MSFQMGCLFALRAKGPLPDGKTSGGTFYKFKGFPSKLLGRLLQKDSMWIFSLKAATSKKFGTSSGHFPLKPPELLRSPSKSSSNQECWPVFHLALTFEPTEVMGRSQRMPLPL